MASLWVFFLAQELGRVLEALDEVTWTDDRLDQILREVGEPWSGKGLPRMLGNGGCFWGTGETRSNWQGIAFV